MDELERAFQENRPDPSSSFVESVANCTARPHASRRIGPAVAATVLAVAAFGAFGGLGYAETAVVTVAKTTHLSVTHSVASHDRSSADKAGWQVISFDDFQPGESIIHAKEILAF